MYAFQTEGRIPLSLTDMAGVVFFAHLFSLAHTVYEQFIVSLGIEWNGWFNHPDFIIPIRSASADYYAPLKGGELYQAYVVLSNLNLDRFSLEVTFESSITCAVIKTQHRFCDRITRKPFPIPDFLFSKLTPHLPLE